MYQQKIYDSNNKPIRIRKMATRVGHREFHNQVIRPAAEGDFAGARDGDGTVSMSCTAMHRRWPNWFVAMTKRLKAMCCCHLCGIPEETQSSINKFRNRQIKELEYHISIMNGGVLRALRRQLSGKAKKQ